ncbi:MAG: WavE lipopolysaccharide synthesis family protein [Rhodobacteraceae bacterium]|nr:WavE lipopolysaccharide synthesis family protein [Paracoccaceae bacterium]
MTRRRLADRLFDRFSRMAIDWQNTRGRSFMTAHFRPRRAAEIGTWSNPAIARPRAAVVMQGPVHAEHDFTLETLRLYARHMPGAQLILSTWSDTSPAVLQPIRDLGVTVVLSEKPAYPGPFNVNMQITSAAAGVRRAVADGAEWVMKTRTDQRLLAPDVLPFLVALAETFPPAAGTGQRRRIIGAGFGSLRFAPYHLTDQTVFGTAEDMLAYWTPPLREPPERDDLRGSAQALFDGLAIGELCRHAAAESYLTSQFLLRMGRRLDWTLVDTWAAWRDHFCVADTCATDLYWVKGQMHSQREHAVAYHALTNRAEMGFRDWLLLHSGALRPADAARHEAVLLDRFNDPVPMG